MANLPPHPTVAMRRNELLSFFELSDCAADLGGSHFSTYLSQLLCLDRAENGILYAEYCYGLGCKTISIIN